MRASMLQASLCFAIDMCVSAVHCSGAHDPAPALHVQQAHCLHICLAQFVKSTAFHNAFAAAVRARSPALFVFAHLVAREARAGSTSNQGEYVAAKQHFYDADA